MVTKTDAGKGEENHVVESTQVLNLFDDGGFLFSMYLSYVISMKMEKDSRLDLKEYLCSSQN